MAEGIYKVTEMFESELCRYTGAPYAVAVDNCSNALFLALTYDGIRGREISIPARTYPSVPCAIIHAGGRVKFEPLEGSVKGKYINGPNGDYVPCICGAYQLKPSRVWDSALRFTHNMYMKGTFMCLSFTGPYKHLKLGKGGAILTDDERAAKWFKRARFSGRRECNYHVDTFDQLGWNFYMMPEIAARGVLLMGQFYTPGGQPKNNADLELPYPDLSKHEAYR